MNDYQAAILPTLPVRNAAAAVEFYKKAFDAEVVFYGYGLGRIKYPFGQYWEICKKLYQLSALVFQLSA